MMHLNYELKIAENPLKALMFPQVYQAQSIADFLDNRAGIEPTGLFLTPHMLFILQSIGKAYVLLNGVNCKRTKGTHQLSDVTGTLDVKIARHPKTTEIEPENSTTEHLTTSPLYADYIRFRDEFLAHIPKPEVHLYRVLLRYQPSTDETVLWHVEIEGPPGQETENEPTRLLQRLRLIPQAFPA